MHETHLLKNLFKYLESEELTSSKKIKRLHVALSEFGGMTPEHFLDHYREASSGTKWSELEFKFTRVPYGPEFEITKIEFSKP